MDDVNSPTLYSHLFSSTSTTTSSNISSSNNDIPTTITTCPKSYTETKIQSVVDETRTIPAATIIPQADNNSLIKEKTNEQQQQQKQHNKMMIIQQKCKNCKENFYANNNSNKNKYAINNYHNNLNINKTIIDENYDNQEQINIDNDSDSNRSYYELNSEQNQQQQQRFSDWIHCMCVVTFDLELGQAMEDIYPRNAYLSEQEKMNICYLAFPDSNSSCMGDTQYHVRLRLSSDNNDSIPLNSAQQKFNSECIPVQRPDLAHYWGFVYFRQKKDKTIPRGYFQKSFIILTRLPFFNLFNEIVSSIAPRYFNDGEQILEYTYNQINNWPKLQAGESYALNLLGTIYQTIIPKSNSKTHNNNNNKKTNLNSIMSEKNCENTLPTINKYNRITTMKKEYNNLININNDDDDDDENELLIENLLCKKCKNEYKKEQEEDEQSQQHEYNIHNKIEEFVGPTLPPQVLNSVHEIDIFRSLSIYISSIYTLWELVLIAEPIVIMGSSPAHCSHMVQSLISLIYPLCYLAESRPYFTIHDSEFREFTSPSIKFSDININNGSGSSGSNSSITGNGSTNQQSTNNSRLLTASSSPPPPPPSIILGVTNPFFGKLLQNWPNMIKLPDNSQQIYSIIPKFSFGIQSNSNNQNNSNKNNATINIDEINTCSSNNSNNCIKNNDLTNYYYNTTTVTTKLSTIKMKNSDYNLTNHLNNSSSNHSSNSGGGGGNSNSSSSSSSTILSNNSNLMNIVTGGGNIIDSNNPPGLYTKYKSFLKKDKQLIKTIQLGIKTKRPEQVQTALLRRHFLELTQSFMYPLERYMASLMPLQKDISPFKAAPNPNEFKQDEFLSKLEQSGPHLTSPLKGNWKGLYKRFFKSPNFKGWYENRYKELKQQLQVLQLQALSDADLNQWAQGKQEVEIVDMIIKLKEKLTLCSDTQLLITENNVLKSPTRIQLLKQIDNITQSLPDDLKIIIQHSTA